MKKASKRNIFYEISRSAFIFSGVILLFLFVEMKTEAAGGTFYHVHSEACYEDEEVACTEHTRSIYTESSTGYCPYCDKTCGTFKMHYYEVCPISGMSVLTDIVITCQDCTNIISTSHVGDMPYHTKTIQTLVCGKTEDTPIATVSFSQSTTESTTSPVTISANVEVLDLEFNLGAVTYSHDGGVTWGTNSSKSYSENGTYSIACKDISGTTFSETFVVDCIVKPAATPAPTPAPVEIQAPVIEVEPEPVIEVTPEPVLELVETVVAKPVDEEEESENTSAPEIVVPDIFSLEKGSQMNRVSYMYDLKYPAMYLDGQEDQSLIGTNIEQEEIKENFQGISQLEEVDDTQIAVQEVGVTYVLSSVYVKALYFIGAGFLLVAFLGCIWYAYRNVMILYEIDNKERFFVAILIAKGSRERKVYISEKQIKKITTKEILLTCYRQEKEKHIAVYTPTKKYQKAWEKEIWVRI